MEVWKSVVGYEGMYEVSNLGNFRSVDRWVRFADGRRRFYEGRSCKLKTNVDGYPLVLLSAGMARKKWCLAHTQVAAAFLGPCPDRHEVCHEDGVPSHIAAANLRYGTRASNHADRMLHGTALFGEKHPSARLSAQTVESIRAAEGTMTEIASRFGVSRTHAWNIRSGKRRDSLSEMISK